ncbi:MAG: hypothetical protein JWQ04_1139 [Pedosphaera sp.]|nr:hypothetical protein [Pedosphaera sp.]
MGMDSTIEFKNRTGEIVGMIAIRGGKSVVRGDIKQIKTMLAFIPKTKALK